MLAIILFPIIIFLGQREREKKRYMVTGFSTPIETGRSYLGKTYYYERKTEIVSCVKERMSVCVCVCVCACA